MHACDPDLLNQAMNERGIRGQFKSVEGKLELCLDPDQSYGSKQGAWFVGFFDALKATGLYQVSAETMNNILLQTAGR